MCDHAPLNMASSTLLFSRRLSALIETVRNSSSISSEFFPASYGSFNQSPPQLYNPFLEDEFLRNHLSYKLPSEVREREKSV